MSDISGYLWALLGREAAEENDKTDEIRQGEDRREGCRSRFCPD